VLVGRRAVSQRRFRRDLSPQSIHDDQPTTRQW
jgi:hypothetical protein